MSSNEVKVGAFTLGGFAVLAGIITFMGAFTFGDRGYELQIDYPQVSGLMPGHIVRYAGVQVGTVKAIDVTSGSVEVTAEIDDNIKIPQGAVFTIGSDGILGEKFVNVIPPANPGQGYITEGSKLKGIPGGGMEEFFASSGDLMVKVENIADALNNVFGDKEVQQSMRDGFKNMRDISENMNTFTKVMADVAIENQKDINAMIFQMNEMSKRMNGVAMHMESIMAGMDNNGETGRNVARMAQNLADTSEKVENIVKVLENVATDPAVEQSLKETVVNAKEASARANKILGTVSDARLQADVSASLSDTDWRSNLGVTLTPSADSFVYMGGYDLGESNKFDFIAGKYMGNAGLSMGAMQGEFGVGLSYNFGDSFKLYSQYYDFDNSKIRLGGELKLNSNLSLYGESMDLKGTKQDTYVGVRSYF